MSRKPPQHARKRELTEVFVRSAIPPAGKRKALFRDTLVRGLALQVTETGTGHARSWVYIYKARTTVRSNTGKTYFPLRTLGLGSVLDVPLAKARDKARQFRLQLLGGNDPLAYRAAQQPALQHPLKAVAQLYYDAHKAEWSNARYAAQWWSQLDQHILRQPIGDMAIDRIATGDVELALTTLWGQAPKTAGDLRGRLEKVWYYAKAKKWVSGENPFAMQGNLDTLLGDPTKRQVGHHASLPYEQLPDFMLALAGETDLIARAVEFAVRTVLRTDAVINARWRDINLTTAMWTVPAEHVKGKLGKRQPFLCPLPPPCIALLEALPSFDRRDDPDAFVFADDAGQRVGQGAMLLCLDRFGLADPRQRDHAGRAKPITMHGFRSTFSDWAHDQGQYPELVIEQAMQHVITNRVKAAYRRGDAYALRQSLMADWSAFCDSLSQKKGGAKRPRLAA